MDCRLLVCDLDNTLLKGSYESSWQLIWDFLDVDPDIRRHGLERFHSGAFSYPDWCAHDAGTFREYGLRRDDFPEICADLHPAPKLRESLNVLRQRDTRMAIVSGALDMILYTALPWYEEFFADVFVNHTRFDENGLLASIIPTRHDFEGKRRCVEELAAEHGVTTDQVVFIGDGMNDLSLAGQVGLTIAFGSSCSRIRQAFDLDLPDNDFRDILPHVTE